VLHKVPKPLQQEYEKESAIIDEGGHSYIYFALDKEGLPCTLKVMKDNSRLKYLREEANILQNNQAKGIIRYIDTVHLEKAFQEKGSHPIILVLEYFEAPSLFKIVNPGQGRPDNLFHEDEVISLGIKVCQVLSFLHSTNVYHLGLSPSSILYDRTTGEIRIIHFGNPEVNESEVTKEWFNYTSPEQQKFSHSICDKTSDLYSLGCILHYCCYGTPKFLPDIRYGKKLSKNFFQKFMHPVPSYRFESAEQLSNALDTLLNVGEIEIYDLSMKRVVPAITTTTTTTTSTTSEASEKEGEKKEEKKEGEKKEESDCVLL